MIDFSKISWGWADAHSHLSDPRMLDARLALHQAREHGLRVFLQGGVGPEDWERQIQFQKGEPGFLPAFGLHPYWVADHSGDECESALNQLVKVLAKAAALGEIGLDFRPHILRDSVERQLHCFESQLEIAQMSGLPLILHVVQAFSESLDVLDHFGGNPLRGLVHAFTGSAAQAHAYIERGLLISVGGALCRKGGHPRLEQTVAQIPLESLLIETDSPDQSPNGVQPGQNSPMSVFQVAGEIARIRKLSLVQVLDNTSANLRKLLNA